MPNKYFQFWKGSFFIVLMHFREFWAYFWPNICVLPKINLVLGIAFSYEYGAERVTTVANFLYFYFWFYGPSRLFHSEPSASLGGAKMGGPLENPPDNPQAELGLSHMMLPELGSIPQRWDEERFRPQKISFLNHFATVATLFLLVLGLGCQLWLWHSLDFLLNFLY